MGNGNITSSKGPALILGPSTILSTILSTTLSTCTSLFSYVSLYHYGLPDGYAEPIYWRLWHSVSLFFGYKDHFYLGSHPSLRPAHLKSLGYRRSTKCPETLTVLSLRLQPPSLLTLTCSFVAQIVFGRTRSIQAPPPLVEAQDSRTLAPCLLSLRLFHYQLPLHPFDLELGGSSPLPPRPVFRQSSEPILVPRGKVTVSGRGNLPLTQWFPCHQSCQTSLMNSQPLSPSSSSCVKHLKETLRRTQSSSRRY